MARRNDHSREEIKKMAIKAGRAIIAREGIHGFSARKTAREIGYSVGTLYNVFTDYDDFMMHINAVTLDELYSYVTEKGGEVGAVPAAGGGTLAVLGMRYIAFAENNRHVWEALFSYVRPPDKNMTPEYREKIGRLFALIEEELRPFLGDKADSRTAQMIWAGVHGVCALGISGKLCFEEEADHAKETREAAQRLLAVCMKGAAAA